MDCKEKFWKALGAEPFEGWPGAWCLGCGLMVGTTQPPAAWLDPSEPEVRLEVLLNGLEKLTSGFVYEFTPGSTETGEPDDHCVSYWTGRINPHIHCDSLRAALIAAICDVVGIEKEADHD